MEGGDRDLCEEVGVGGEQQTQSMLGILKVTVWTLKSFFFFWNVLLSASAQLVLAVLGRNAPLGAAGPAARS